VEQLEDQKYQGKITARYVFKGDQVISQEQLENAEPPRVSAPFTRVEDERRNITEGAAMVGAQPATAAILGLESGPEIK
jgi:hypothetical protein